MDNHFDVVIIGGGASGLFCASLLGKKNIKTLVLEKNKSLGRKILISGGGRCNFTNKNITFSNFQSLNNHFFKSALSRYTSQDFIDLVDQHKIKWFEKEDGQLFCETSAKDIIAMLLKEINSNNSVEILTSQNIKSVGKKDHFVIQTLNEEYTTENLIMASGGLSIPTIGASDFGYQVAKKFNLKLVETSPALVPYVNDQTVFDTSDLSGVSLPVQTTVNRVSHKGSLLFTHKGLSGPVILTNSLYYGAGDTITIDFLPEEDVEHLIATEKKRSGKRKLETILKGKLPERFLKKWVEAYGSDKEIANLKSKEIQKFTDSLKSWKIVPKSTEGYRKAEVTKGGVSTSELSSKTMESKKIDNLYFIGEVVDVTGELGGYNFQWAWASAFVAAEAIINHES